MNRNIVGWIVGWVLLIGPISLGQDSGVELLATVRHPGTTLDKSGFEGILETGNPVANFGGLSAMDYSPDDKTFVVLSDRGPADGESSFPCRFHSVRLDLRKTEANYALSFELLSTHPLTQKNGTPLTGSLAKLRQWDSNGRCPSLDPEGIRRKGAQFVISDEYGPTISVFSKEGKLESEFAIPKSYLLSGLRKPAFEEGTYTNRGLEGLALTPGGMIVGAMQGPLVQDGRIENNKCLGTMTRWIVLNPNGESQQWVYPLTDESTGVSEVLAIDEHRFLVLERDSNIGAQAAIKHIYWADAQAATDVSPVQSLRSTSSSNIQVIKKRLLIDLLNPAYGFAGDRAPEKPEGLAWGAPLLDGRRQLMVCFDNDFVLENDTIFAAFAVEDSKLR